MKRSAKFCVSLLAVFALVSTLCFIPSGICAVTYSVNALEVTPVNYNFVDQINYTASVYLGGVNDSYTTGANPYIAVSFMNDEGDGFALWVNNTYVGEWNLNVLSVASEVVDLESVVHAKANVSDIIIFEHNGTAFNIYDGSSLIHTEASAYNPLVYAFVDVSGNDTAYSGTLRVNVGSYVGAMGRMMVPLSITLESLLVLSVTLGVVTAVMGMVKKFKVN